MTRSGTRTRLLVAGMAVAAVASAGLVTTGAAGAQTGVRGVTATEIVVGGLGDAAAYGDASRAAQARFEEANRDGEIPGGRAIRYVGFADDKSTPDLDAAEARRLVESVGVFAVVPVMSPVVDQAGTYFNDQKVPAVGWGIAPGFCASANRYVFGFTGCLVPDPAAYPSTRWSESIDQVLKLQGKGSARGKTAAIVADSDAAGKTALEGVVATAEAVGMTVVYRQATVPAPPSPTTDWTSYVQAIMNANSGQPPDATFVVTAPASAVALGSALERAGYRGVVTNAVTYAPSAVHVVAGWEAFTQFATPESGAVGMQELVATLEGAGIKPIGQPALAGYFAADMFVEVLKRVGKNVTPERFQRVAAKYTYQIQDVVGPTTYPAGFDAGTPCGQLAVSDGTKFTITVPFDCTDVLARKGSKWVPVQYPRGVK